MMDGVLRQVKEKLLLPAAQHLGSRVSPTTLTLMAGIAGGLSAVAAWQGSNLLGLGLWWLNRTLDGLDGTVARVSGQQSDWGGYLDLMLDFFVYTVIPFGLVMRQPSLEGLVILAFVFGVFYINAGAYLYLAALLERREQGAKQRGELTSITMPGGVIEGTEAVIFFSLFFLLPDWFIPLLLLLGVLVAVSAVQRLVWAARYLR